MFITLNGDTDLTAKYIKSVTYHLHSTFTPSVIKIVEAPFLIARVGWGCFKIKMDVEYHEWTGMPKATLQHMLSFDGNGRTSSIVMEISEQANKDEIAKGMSQAMENLGKEEYKNRYN
jgi:transcription initiation factor IIF auxiliary subunit